MHQQDESHNQWQLTMVPQTVFKSGSLNISLTHSLTLTLSFSHTHIPGMQRAIYMQLTWVTPIRTSLPAELPFSNSGPLFRNPPAPHTNPFDRIDKVFSNVGSFTFPLEWLPKGF